MRIISHLGYGPTFDGIEKDGYLYVAEGTIIRVFDVSSDEKAKAIVWNLAHTEEDLNSFIKIIKNQGNYLYVLTVNTLFIYDISIPGRLNYRGRYIYPGRIYEHKGLALSGNYAYIGSRDIGIIAVNVSDVTHPTLVSAHEIDRYAADAKVPETNRPYRMTIDGNMLYCGTEQVAGTFWGIDISDPQHIRSVAKWTTPDINIREKIKDISACAVYGDYIIVTEYYIGLHIFERTPIYDADPNNPLARTYNEVGFIPGLGYNDIMVRGNRAYVSVRYGGYDTFDLTSLPTPTKVQSIAPQVTGYTEGIFVTPSENRVYLCVSTMGFIIYDNSNVSVPSQINKIAVCGGAVSLAKMGNDVRLYVGMWNENIWSVNVGDKLRPARMGYTFTSGRHEGLGIQGNILYVAGDWSQLSIFKIPQDGSFETLTYRYGPALSSVLPEGVYLYGSEYQVGNFIIYNIQNPSAPSIVPGSQIYVGSQGKMQKYGDYIIAAGSYPPSTGTPMKGLHVIDVRNKNAPVLLRTYIAGMNVTDVKIDDTVVYAVADNDVYAFSVPALISGTGTPQLSHLNYGGVWSGKALTVDPNNKILYAVGPTVKAFDISDPSNMTEKASEELILNELGYDILYSDGYLYAADYYSGLYVIDPQAIQGTNISVTSAPSEARIYLDGNDTGKVTNLILLNVTPGTHQVKLVLAEYEDYIQSVEVVKDQTSYVNAILKKIVVQGILKIRTLLAPALTQVNGGIFINDAPQGVGIAVVTLDPGTYTVRFGTLLNYIVPKTVSARVVSGATTEINGIYSIAAVTTTATKSNVGGIIAAIGGFAAGVVILRILKKK